MKKLLVVVNALALVAGFVMVVFAAPKHVWKPAKAQLQAAKKIGQPVFWANSLGMKFVLIPPGSFMMGSPAGRGDPDERPRHRVVITKGFYLQATEVTNAQFAAFVKATGYKTEAEKRGGADAFRVFRWERVKGASWRHPQGPNSTIKADYPVVQVSWNDARAFCRWLSKKTGHKYRLPYEAEWEYAARAGTTTTYSFGDKPARLGDYAWHRGNTRDQSPYGRIHPVGRKRPNAWGLFDTHGNVREWCRDWYDKDYYASSPAKDPRGPAAGSHRIVRGGSYADGPALHRSAHRAWSKPQATIDFFGFRVVREP